MGVTRDHCGKSFRRAWSYGGRGGQGVGPPTPSRPRGSPRRGGPLVACAPVRSRPAADPAEAPGGPHLCGRLSPQRGRLQERARPYLTQPRGSCPRRLRRQSPSSTLCAAPGTRGGVRARGRRAASGARTPPAGQERDGRRDRGSAARCGRGRVRAACFSVNHIRLFLFVFFDF